MVKRKLLLGILFLGLVFASLYFVSAVAVINSVTLNDTDNFYSNYSGNRLVHLLVNASGTDYLVAGGGYVYANFSALGASTDCGAGSNQISLSNATYGGDIFNGTCDVGDEASLSNFSAVGAAVILASATPGPPTANSNSNTVILYNMTLPPQPPANSCIQFGPLTTNFTSVLDFAHVNFMVHIQNNFTCMTQGNPSFLPTSFVDVLIMNLTSVNLSTPEQAQKLSLLSSAITPTIPAPRTFPSNARIFVNTTVFSDLNTNATIGLLNIPFTGRPNVTADTPSEFLGSSWVSNGYDSRFRITTGNLTINVTGFSGYNATDLVLPTIAINSPAATINNSQNNTMVVAVIINGTGSEPSYISISNMSGGASYIYNGSNASQNTAQCFNMTMDRETFNCTFAIGLTNGSYNLSVTAWDFGGAAPGNINSSSKLVRVDTDFPLVYLVSPLNGTYQTSAVTFNFNSTDMNTQSSLDCNLFLDRAADQVNFNVSSINLANIVNSTTITGIADGLHNWTLECFDGVGNYNTSTTRFFTSDSTKPTIDFGNFSEVDGVNLTRTNIIINVTANDTLLTNLTVYISNSSGIVNSSNVSSAGGVKALLMNTTSLADGIYYINATTFDLSGNSNTTSTRRIAIDTTAPVISLTLTSASTTTTTLGITISAVDTTGLNGTCNVSGGVAAAISGTSLTDSGLACGTSYTYNVSCYDYVGNSGIKSSSFSTSACATTTTTDSSTSAGQTTQSAWSTTFTAEFSQFTTTGYTKSIAMRERVKCIVNNENHYVGVVGITSTTATINVSSDPQQATFNVKDVKKFDVTADGYYDIQVTLNNIVGIKANITMLSINEKMPATTVTGNVVSAGQTTTTATSQTNATNQTSTEAAEKAATPLWKTIIKIFIIALGVMLVVVLIIIIAARIKKQRSHHHQQ